MGILALMGSGELTATMVEVHKMLLSRLQASPSAVFLDTPAGFQLNADQIGAGAVEYFRKRVGHSLGIASYKSSATVSEVEAARAYQQLRAADYILMGPGSPTYTVTHLVNSQIPAIFTQHVRNGGCLVAASAAALTAGRYTLPVYEIYKVGLPLHWVDGLDILGALGLQLIVIPHWNNAEGGTHDTSRCFMGGSRYDELLSQLKDPIPVLGLDEHTACVIDFAEDVFEVFGLGGVILESQGNRHLFATGKRYPLEVLRGGAAAVTKAAEESSTAPSPEGGQVEDSDFWLQVHDVRKEFERYMRSDNAEKATTALLELDRLLWQAEGNKESSEMIAQGRDLFREQLAEFGTKCSMTFDKLETSFYPLVENLLHVRQQLRHEKHFTAGDKLREALLGAGVLVEDTAEGFTYHHMEKMGDDE